VSKPATAPPIDLSYSNPRKVGRLKPHQAYSRLFCKKGTPAHTELREAWELFTGGDEDTRDKYRHLFPTASHDTLPFVTFQQVILKDRMSSIPKEEMAAVQVFIEKHYQEETDRREHPWIALKVDDAQSNIDLETQYLEE
jgi:hypothetical protein